MTTISLFKDFEGYPRSMVAPDFSIAAIGLSGSETIVGGAQLEIKHATSSVTPPDSNNWHALYKSVFSWSISAIGIATHPGAVLEILTSMDGFIFTTWRCYMIGNSLTTPFASVFQGLYIPAYGVRFTLINSSDSEDIIVHGIIKQQGMK